MRILLLCFSFLFACCGDGLSAAEMEQKPRLDKLCACKDEACITKYASAIANSVREREVKVSDAESSAITKKVFACTKKARANYTAGAGEAEDLVSPPAGSETVAEVAAPKTKEDLEKIAAQKRQEELKNKVDKQISEYEKLATPQEIVAAFEKDAALLCECSSKDCLFGTMPKLKALGVAIGKLSAADATAHKSELTKASNELSQCLKKAYDQKLKMEAQVTEVGEAIIKASSQYADDACACTTMECLDSTMKKHEKNTGDLKPKTAGDAMNERLVAQTTRAMQCYQKIFQAASKK